MNRYNLTNNGKTPRGKNGGDFFGVSYRNNGRSLCYNFKIGE